MADGSFTDSAWDVDGAPDDARADEAKADAAGVAEPSTGGDPEPTSLIIAPPTEQLSTIDVGPPSRLAPLGASTPGGDDEPQIWVQRHRTPARLDARLVMLREPDSWRAACYRVLRHRLEERGNPRTIAVSSAERREGKTTCAVNLATALGECARARVLLVEANLRYPSLATLFGYAPPTCLSAQLERHKQLPGDPWSVVEVYSPALHVAAMDPENGGRPLLDGPAFTSAMRAFQRAPYDYIVVDTPAVLGGADVNLIEDCVDGVLLCAWARRSSGRSLRRAVEQLAPGKVLGVMLLDE